MADHIERTLPDMNGLNGTTASSYMRLLACARPYTRRLAAALACMFVASACNIVPPWLLKNVVDDVLIQKDLAMLNTLPFLLVALFIGKGLASYGHQYLMNWTGQRVVMDLRLLLYDHLQRMSLKYLYGKRLGELMSRITNDVSILQNLVTSVLVNLVVQAVTFVGMVAFLLYINWRLSLVAFAVIPLTVLILDRASRRLRSVGTRSRASWRRCRPSCRRPSGRYGGAPVRHGGPGAGALRQEQPRQLPRGDARSRASRRWRAS